MEYFTKVLTIHPVGYINDYNLISVAKTVLEIKKMFNLVSFFKKPVQNVFPIASWSPVRPHLVNSIDHLGPHPMYQNKTERRTGMANQLKKLPLSPCMDNFRLDSILLGSFCSAQQ